ncbi:hypothetical protein Tco_0821946 [Tanacetum coccineum]|uniref:Uncharacterized protein n=1 Tax=Tanacetum coccineum TaxID=301880 RepID=A0ABQ5AGT5_9ASTR
MLTLHQIFQAYVKEIGTWSILISNDLESNDSDNDRDYEEHISINENVDLNETFDNFIKHTAEDKDILKASAQGHQLDDSNPPDIKKDFAINDEATPRVVNVGDFSSLDTVKDEHIVTYKENFFEEDVSDISKPLGFEKFVKENKKCSRSPNSSRSGKKNGWMMLDSIDEGPLVYPTVVGEDGQPRPKKYSELSEAQQLQDDCDVQAINIILHGLSPDVLYNLFDKFAFVQGETLYEYYLRFSQLINEMHTIRMTMQQVQVNTKFLNALPPE